MSIYKITIPGNTPSKKNSQQIYINEKTNKPFITSSNTHKNWYPQAFEAVSQSPLVLKEWKYPLHISFHFIRETNHAFDYINLAQGICDLLVDARIIEDDNMQRIIPKDWSFQVRKGIGCCIVTIEEHGNN